MGLFDGLFPAAKESQSTLFSTESLFRRHAAESDKTSNKGISAAPFTALQQSHDEQQVAKKAKIKAPAAAGMTADNASAGEKGRAPEAAIAAPGRKRKAHDAASVHASLAEAPAGIASAQPAKRTKTNAAGTAGHPDKAAGKHAQKPAASKPEASTQKRTAPRTAGNTVRERHHAAERGSAIPVPASTSKASDSQPARKRTAQRSQSTGNGADTGIAGALYGDVGSEETSADEMAGAEEPAAHTAGGAAGAKSKLTEEQRQERLQRTVFVGNLPAAVKAKRLKQAFSQFGAVESVRLRSLPLKEGLKMPRKAAIASGNVDAERAPAHAYIVFGNRASSVYALQLNMSEFEGRHIRVDLAAGVSKSIRGGGKNVLYDSGKSVFLGNLPFDVVEEDLIRLFGGGRGAGSVSAVRVVRDAKTNKGKGIAYVEFQTRSDSRMALGFDGHTLNGRAIRVSRIAAGPSAADQQHGDSKLRTPYSKGVKPGKSFGKGKESMTKRGVSARPSAAAWQGMRTKGQSKLVKGSAAKPRDAPTPEGGQKPGHKAAQPPGKAKRVGKRPAVAARKTGAVQKGRK